MEKILVTGGAGYIGSHAAKKLLMEGFQVTVFDNITTGFKEAIPKECRFVFGDIRKKEILKKTLLEYNIDAVVHFAAKLNVAESSQFPLEYYYNNTLGVMNLVQACGELGIDKMVFSSTAAVYGEKTAVAIRETDLKSPINPYGHSKLFSEQIITDAGKSQKLKSVILRYFNVAGAADDGMNGQRTAKAYHLIHLAAWAALGKIPKLGIFGNDYPTPDGTCVRDFIHVEDLADIHVLALKHLLNGGEAEILNCGYGKGFSVKEVIDSFKRITKVDFPVENMPRRIGDPASLVADSSRLKALFGWNPKRSDIELICKSAYEWEKRHSSKSKIS